MRRSAVIAIVLVGMAVLFLGGTSLFASPTDDGLKRGNATEPTEREIVRPTDGDSGFWPYLSPKKKFQKRSPINVVVLADGDQVRRALIQSGGTNWEEAENETLEADSDTYSLTGGNESSPNGTNASNGTNGTDATNGTAAPNATTVPNATSVPNATNTSANAGNRFDVATSVGWGGTTGATRYAYVDPGPDEEGRWISETDQFHDGTYYGSRYHIRMYESPDRTERWVAIQTHSEHFDWFTLRHHVTGSQRAQTHLERDLMALPTVDEQTDVRRVYLDNGNSSDADGWATFVDLAALLFVGTLGVLPTSKRELRAITNRFWEGLNEADRERIEAISNRIDRRHVAMAMTIVGIVVGVRFAGIALERADVLSMHAIAALLYPVLALGMPIATYLIARGLERRLDAAVVASGAFAVAIWLDYGFLGVNSLPIEVLVQRSYTMIALGLIAGGAAKRATRDHQLNGLVAAGALLWFGVLVGTLFGYF